MSVRTAERIEKCSDPLVPQFAFEWHPVIQKVYLLEIPGRHEGGEFVPDSTVRNIKAVCIAEHCEHHARFFGFVQTFLRGFKLAVTQTEQLRESGLAKRAEELRHSGLLKGITDG